MDSEQWRTIPGFEAYQASSLGRIRGPRGLLREYVHRNGHHRVLIGSRKTNDRRLLHVHRLVAQVFVDGAGPVVRHLDGDPHNNAAVNLAWGTQQENVRDTVRHGRNRNSQKTRCSAGHPYDEANTYTYPDGRRECRVCRAEKRRRWEAARRA